jgi:hypothetical protein
MAKTKKIKYKQADGTLSDYVAIGADASNVDLAEGITLEILNTKLVRNDNSTLTDAQGNTINPKTKVENITNKNNVTLETLLNNNIIQYSAMPTANSANLGKIVQYIGTTTTSFTKGYFYECTTTDGNSYKWVTANVQKSESLTFDSTPTAGSKNPVTSEGIKNYVDNIDLSKYYTKTETDNLLKNIDLSNYYTKTEIDGMIGDIETLLASI